MSEGKLADGSRLFSAATARQLTTIVTPMPIGDPPPELAPLKMNFHGYALGFDVRDYRGHKVLMHTGGLPGFLSRVAMIPDLNVGVAVLTNQESGAAFDSIAFRILDHYLGAPAFDWIDGYKRTVERIQAATAAIEKNAATTRNASVEAVASAPPSTPAPIGTRGTATSRSRRRTTGW